MSKEETGQPRAMSDSVPGEAPPPMFPNGLGTGDPPAASIPSTNGSGIGTPVDDTVQRPPFPRLDTANTEPSSHDQDSMGQQDHAGAEFDARRPSIPQPEMDGTSDYPSSPSPTNPSEHFELFPDKKVPVLVDYSAVLNPLPEAGSPAAFLVIEYEDGQTLSNFKSQIQVIVRTMGGARVNVQETVDTRVEHMHLGIAWEQGESHGRSVPLDDCTFKTSMKLMRARGLRDRVVVLFDPRKVPTSTPGNSKSKGKGRIDVADRRKPGSQEPYLGGQLTEYKDDVIM